MKISRREAFLLFLLGLLAIGGLTYAFVIMPLNNKIDANKVKLLGLEAQKTIVDATLPLEPILKQRRENLYKEVSDELNRIETPMNAAQFDRWMLPLTTLHETIVIGATFTETNIVSPDSVVTPIYDPMYKIRSLILEYNKEALPSDGIPATTSQLLHSRFTYRVKTDYLQFRHITRDISSWDTTIYLNEASYDFETGEGLIAVDVYMIHKLVPDPNPKDYSGDFIPGRDNLIHDHDD